jgi:hypothetical protein
MRRRGALFGFGMAALAAGACNGTTGDELIPRFAVYAAGAPGASEPFTAGGFTIQLTKAKMHIGALYFDESPPSTGFDSPICIAAGIYAAQVPGPADVDLLSTAPQEFSVYGNGTADTALSWQIWLTDGDINEPNTAQMVDLEGVATRISDGAEFSFGAVVTINDDNRLPTTSDPSQPGLNPICKERIVQIGGIDVAFFPGGTLYVTVDPRGWFKLNLDFSTLPLGTSASCAGNSPGPAYCIPDTSFATGAGATQGQNLFTSILTAGPAAYSVRYSN